MMRSIINIISAIQEDIGDLKTYRAMPTPKIQMIDPFLFLNHHGHQVYEQNNNGLPFAPHPHRGFETVTFILKGDIAHKDSTGSESVINAGGVQWMTAGSGIIHEEISSKQFKREGGELEILQLWVNLPSRLKWTTPAYKGLQKEFIPSYQDEGSTIHLISGKWKTHEGPFKTLTNVTCMTIEMGVGAEIGINISQEENIFFYLINGELEINQQIVTEKKTVLFSHDGDHIKIKAQRNSEILLCHALPINETVITYGPFVMNTKEEIRQAISDYQNGKFA